MDDEEYEQLLTDFINDQENQEEINDILTKMSESDILEYLGLNLIIFSKLQNQAVCKIAITLIFAEAKKGTIFSSNDDAITFWSNFVQIIPDSFESKILPDSTKYLVSDIISYFAVNFYKFNQNDEIQEYLLNLLEENDNFETYIIISIEEIVISSHNFGGFPLEALLKIVTVNPLQFDASVIPRLKLYFAIVLRVFKSDEEIEDIEEIKSELIDLFPQLFEATPASLFDKMISTTAIFAESYSEFFEPHLSSFVPLLCNFAKDPNCTFRNNAIFCIESLCIGSINMCSSLESYYEPVITTLISIISEISEDSPVEEDLNNDDSYIIANNVLSTFLKNCQNYAVYTFIENFFKETVSDIAGVDFDDPNFDYKKVPWSLIYAFIYALSYRNSLLDFTPLNRAQTENEHEDENEGELFLEEEEAENSKDNYIYNVILLNFIPFLTDPNSIIHLKIAICDMITSYSKCYYFLYQNTYDKNIVAILFTNIIEETNIYLQNSLANALKCYIKNGRAYLTEDDYFNVFLYISENLSSIPLNLIPYFIRILKYFVNHQINQSHPETISIYANSIFNLYDSSHEASSNNDKYLDIQIDIFNSFIKLFLNKFEREPRMDLFTSLSEIPEKVLSMLKDAIMILSEHDRCKDENKLKNSIIKCIILLEQNALPVVDQFDLLGHSLEDSNGDISIYKYFQFDLADEDMSIMEKVECFDDETNAGAKFYALKSEIKEIDSSLHLLLCIIRIIKSEFPIENLDDVVNMCQKWITNVYHLETIKSKAWLLLIELFKSFSSFPQAVNLLSCFIDDFMNCFGVGSTIYNELILKGLIGFMSIKVIEQSSIPSILAKTTDYADDLFKEINKINNDLLNYKLIKDVILDEEKLTRKISLCRNAIDSIFSIIETSMIKYTEETVLFIQNSYIEKAQSYLKNVESFEFALQIFTLFISVIKDVNEAKKLITILFGYLAKCLHQVSFIASSCLIRLYSSIELPIDFIESLVKAYQNFFLQTNTEMLSYSDMAVGTFSVILSKYELQMKECPPLELNDESDLPFDNLFDSAVLIFINASPIYDDYSFSNYAYDFLAYLLENQNKFIMESYDYIRIWQNIIININDENSMSEKVSLRFKNLICEMSQDEQYQDLVELLFADFQDEHKGIWNRVIEEQNDGSV